MSVGDWGECNGMIRFETTKIHAAGPQREAGGGGGWSVCEAYFFVGPEHASG